MTSTFRAPLTAPPLVPAADAPVELEEPPQAASRPAPPTVSPAPTAPVRKPRRLIDRELAMENSFASCGWGRAGGAHWKSSFRYGLQSRELPNLFSDRNRPAADSPRLGVRLGAPDPRSPK